MDQSRAPTRPEEVAVETADGQTWYFRLDYRAYEEIADRTGVDLTTREGQRQLMEGQDTPISLKVELFSAAFRSGFLHERKRQLMEEEGLTSVRAVAKARPVLEELPPEAVKAAVTADLIDAVEDKVDDLRESMADQADDQEEALKGEEPSDPLGETAAAPGSGGPAGSSEPSPPPESSSA
ncbi:MAG: hypothetical protein ACOC5E_01940 [Acidobacteriota bacterium]